MAIGAIRALRDRGLRVPEDVSVIGLDGLAIGDYMLPRLTTVRQSVEELADRAVQILEQQLSAATLAPRHETIPSAVDAKESTRSLKE
jgi:LacI family transcriptional regulator